MDRRDFREGFDSAKDGAERAGARVTKTRLRRGEVRRDKCPEAEAAPSADIIDFLPSVHGDIEDLLCDGADESPPDDEPT